MCTKRIVALLYAVAGSVPLVVAGEQDAKIVAGPPELGTAVIVDGRTLEVSRFVVRMVRRTTTSNLPPGITIEARAGDIAAASTTEVVPVVETHIYRIDATEILVRRIDGRAVPYKVLMDELAKPTAVLLAKQDQQVAPLFSKLFRSESLVLPFPTPTRGVPDYVAPISPPQ